MGTLRFDYDDPYKILAHYIVGFYRPADVVRVLSDDGFVATLVQKETRESDIGGHFLDCIIEEIFCGKKRMEYMHQLDALSRYYYSELDLSRLRKEIRLILSEAGIELPDYFAAGNVSLAST